jgi:diaminopimelate decarboxylase
VHCAGEHVTAVTHAGADLLLRTAYCPEKFPHRLRLLSKEGSVKGEEAGSIDTTVAGPLCFSGDIVASHIAFPKCAPGDRCVVMDAGANTVSLHRYAFHNALDEIRAMFVLYTFTFIYMIVVTITS